MLTKKNKQNYQKFISRSFVYIATCINQNILDFLILRKVSRQAIEEAQI